MQKKISFVLPAYNEELALPVVINTIPKKELEELGYEVEILIVNNNSTDNTERVAVENGARVVKEEKKGYGYAYKKGFQEATGDIIITGDADNTYPFEDSVSFIKQLEEENLDFLSTNRFANIDKKSMTFRNRAGNKAFQMFTNFLFNLKLQDSWSGMWIFKRDILTNLNITSNGMPLSQEIKIEAFKKTKAKEIPVQFNKVRIGEAKLEAWRDGLKTLKFLIWKRFTFK